MNIQDYGFYGQVTPENNIGIPARITAVHRDSFAIVCDLGSGLAHIKRGEYYAGSESFPTTGDFVVLDWQEHNASRIIKTLPRRTYFTRLDPSSAGQKEQAVAANFDYVFIIQSLERDFNLRRLERYLTLAWQSGATPVAILTKADCVEEYQTQVRAAEKLAIGVQVLAVSANTGLGLEQLEKYLQPRKTIVFLGSSGVGKSTLLNKLAGRDIMSTGEVRESDGRGKHTTSHRQLILLDSGVMIIDTPGMRELGMWDVSEGLEQSFADVEQYLGRCRFGDCQHQSEPGCAVKKAISSGELSQERWESYMHLNEEARFTSDKAGYLREKQQWQKEISKKIKAMQAPSYQHTACTVSFTCKVCGAAVAPEDAGSKHRNHCPKCLSSLHVDNKTGDRASLCQGIMDAIGVWVRKNGEWAIIHRCRACGELSSNRVAADDNPTLLMSIAVKPLAMPPFSLWNQGEG